MVPDSEGNWEGNHLGTKWGDGGIELALGKYKLSKFKCPAGRWRCKPTALEGSRVRYLELSFSFPQKELKFNDYAIMIECAYFGICPITSTGKMNPGHSLNILNFWKSTF